MPYGLTGGSNIVTGVWCLEVTVHLLNISCSCVLVSDDISRSVPLVMAGMGHALLAVMDTE